MQAKRVVVITLILTVVSIFLLVSYFQNQISNSVMIETKKVLVGETTNKAKYFEDQLADKIRTLKFLHATPPIQGITRARANQGVDPLDMTTEAQWRNRLSTIFAALLENNPDIYQLRIISTEQPGQEFLRVDRTLGRIDAAPEHLLQNKAQEDYYLRASELRINQIFVSQLNLNKEFGKIAYPLQPTFRIAMPIFYDSGARFGFLIMNIDISNILNDLVDTNGQTAAMWLLDSQGFFVFHPDSDNRFTRQLPPNSTLSNDYIVSPIKGGLLRITDISQKHPPVIAYEQPIFTGSQIEQRLRLFGTVTLQSIKQLESRRRLELYIFSGGAFLIIVVVLIAFYRSLETSLRLNEINSTFQAVINGSNDAVICIDNSGTILNWNPAAENMFAKPAIEVLNTDIDQCIELHEHSIKDAISSHKQFNFEDSFTSVYQGNREVNVFIRQIDNIQNSMQRFALQIRDITTEKQNSKQLQINNQELEYKINERTIELQQRGKELEKAHQKVVEASRAKSSFISMISHEMRTPLNGMIGSLNLLKRDPLTTSQQKYLEMTETSTNVLSALINDVLDMSKIESGKLEIEKIQFNPLELIETTAHSASVLAKENNLELIIDIAAIAHKQILSDPNRLKQILSNLISNAIKFTESGEIVIRASSFSPHGKLDIVRLKVEVIDTGIGIAEDNQSKLFKPFTQETSSVSARFGGTGLGLSICRQLCHLMNGEITLTSKKDKGSCFSFHIDTPAHQSVLSQTEDVLNGLKVGLLITRNNLKAAIQRSITQYGGQASLLSAQQVLETPHQYHQFQAVIIDEDQVDYESLQRSLYELKHSTDNDKVRLITLTNDQNRMRTTNDNELRLSKPVLHKELLEMLTGKCQQVPDPHRLQQGHTATRKNIEILKNARVLLVDDNQINQEVAKGFIGSLVNEIQTASNGVEALERLEHYRSIGKPFHCILMDCQMPEMNGYECAKCIRIGKNYAGITSIPILAMTANAMAGEKEKCLGFGMNDYITKPINEQEIIEKLSKWAVVGIKQLGKPGHADKTANKSQPPAVCKRSIEVEFGSAETIPVWDKQTALARLMSNEDLFTKILQIFQSSGSEDMCSLEAAISSKNLTHINQVSHRLKGASGDIGAGRLHKLLAEVEALAKKEEFDSRINSLFEQIQLAFTALIKDIKLYLANQ